MLFSNTFTYSHKNIAANVIKLFICFCIYFNSFTFAHAAGLGGWSLGSPVAQGASAVYDGTKKVLINGAEKIAKGTAKITPNAAQVAKVLRGGAYGYALSVAVEQLLGAVDWVLDPANNQIVYTKKDEDLTKPPTSCQYYFKVTTATPSTVGYGCTVYQAATNHCANRLKHSSVSYCNISNVDESAYTLTMEHSCKVWNGSCSGYRGTVKADRIKNPAFDENQVPEKKILPLQTVAQQVISNAESSDQEIKVGAQAVTMAAAQDIVNEAENDSVKAYPIVQQLEQSKSYPVDNTATGEAATRPDVSNPDAQAPPLDLTLEFPAFCGWAPVVCEAAQTVISFPQTLTNWWETANTKADGWVNSISEAWASVREYFREEAPEKENTETDIEEIPVPTDGVKISIGDDVCPSYYVTILDKQRDLSPVYLCQIATGMKAFFIAFGFWTASMIVGRRH